MSSLMSLEKIKDALLKLHLQPANLDMAKLSEKKITTETYMLS